MKTGQIITATLIVVMAISVAASARSAEMPTEPRGGQPPKGSKPSVENFAEQVAYQRAFEAVVWSMLAMIMLSALSQDTALTEVSKEVEAKTIQMVDEAK